MLYSYRLEQAIRAAAVLHRDQARKGSTPIPYITHLMTVAFLVADYTEDEDTVIAALLHDTLEDTDYTEDELRGDFGNEVAELVLALTEEGEGWRERKDAYAAKLKSAPDAALLVAASDKIHNMRCIIEEYYSAHERFVKDFGGSLDDRVTVYQKISNILNRRLDNDIIHEFNHVFDEYKKFISDVQKTV